MHYKEIKGKLATQALALSRLTGKTHGPNLLEARLLYTSIIRPTIIYGAVVLHTPTQTDIDTVAPPRGLAKKMITEQNSALRLVLGAYKATPIRNLEVEANIPP